MKTSTAVQLKELCCWLMASEEGQTGSLTVLWGKSGTALGMTIVFIPLRKLKSRNRDWWDCSVFRCFFILWFNHVMVIGEPGPADDKEKKRSFSEIFQADFKIQGMLLSMQSLRFGCSTPNSGMCSGLAILGETNLTFPGGGWIQLFPTSKTHYNLGFSVQSNPIRKHRIWRVVGK